MVEFGEGIERIGFSISGYEFESAHDPHDRNWLIVEVTGLGTLARRKSRSAALLTWELRRLTKFLIERNNEDRLGFMEPDLEFSCHHGVVSIELRYGLRLNRGPDVEIFSCKFDENWRKCALHELEKACATYPVR